MVNVQPKQSQNRVFSPLNPKLYFIFLKKNYEMQILMTQFPSLMIHMLRISHPLTDVFLLTNKVEKILLSKQLDLIKYALIHIINFFCIIYPYFYPF